MFCHRCGAKNPDEAQYCMKCGHVIGRMNIPPESVGTANRPIGVTPTQSAVYTAPQSGIPSYLIPAILITIFSSLCCCNPIAFVFGVIAIIYASQVDTKLAEGNKAGAEEYSRKAKSWCWIAGITILVLTILFFILSFSFGHLNSFMKHLPMGNTI